MRVTVSFAEKPESFAVGVSDQNQSFEAGFSGTTMVHDGTNGATFFPSVSEDGILSWTNDRGLENPAPVLVKGADGRDGKDGKPGETGAKGDRGEPGAKGDKGDKGDTGATGPQGPKGDKGDKGDQGPAGANGQPGKDGEPGEDGEPGKDGYTPVKGTDYWTDADKTEMVAAVIAALPVYGGEYK